MTFLDSPPCIPGTPVLSILTLSKIIAAIPIVQSDHGKLELGLFSQLPSGAELSVCGDGFDDRTVAVHCRQSRYFVFREDLERSARASALCA